MRSHAIEDEVKRVAISLAGHDGWTGDAKTGARVKAVPQKEETSSLAMAFGAPASMALGLSLIVWGWRMKG